MSTGTWARRTGMTAVATVAVTALAVPVGARAATDAPAAAPA
ncbi:hydrolase, partial [Streptomyces sp. SID89]|nr:hydrolase [Streptomyces sp. SID89]